MSWLEDIILLVIVGFLLFIVRLQKRILKKMADFDVELGILETETSETRGVVDSAVVLINGLSDKLDAALADDADDATRLARVAAVNDALKASKDSLAAAVAANDDVPDEPPTP